MFSSLRAPFLLAAGLALSACQLETGTQPVDFATQQAEREARTLSIVETCRLSECGRLNLDSGLLSDYSILADMTHVNALMMSFTDFENLSAIAPMSQLRELHIGQSRVSDLSGLSNFPNLRLLHAQNLYDVEDYSAVAGLTALEELVIGASGFDDLGVLAGMRNLKTLNIDNSGVTDLSPLVGLSSLETLDMMGMRMPDDLSPLLRMRSLKTVSMSGWTGTTPEQQAVIDTLTERGVEFLVEVAVIAC